MPQGVGVLECTCAFVYCHLRNLGHGQNFFQNQLIFGSNSKSLIAHSILDLLLRFLYILASQIEICLPVVLNMQKKLNLNDIDKTDGFCCTTQFPCDIHMKARNQGYRKQARPLKTLYHVALSWYHCNERILSPSRLQCVYHFSTCTPHSLIGSVYLF
jgi:hypothetical protein